MENIVSEWKQKYNTLEEYYYGKYPKKYFEFDKYELQVDPDETPEVVDAYSIARQTLEIKRCTLSFNYFATKYARVLHPKEGLVPFIQYNYQKRVVKKWEEDRFTIIRKFRQGGLTTLAEVWGVWKCLFNLDQQIMLVSKTDREAIAAGEIVNRLVQSLPKWLKPDSEGKWNDHQKQFLDTGGNIFFYTPEAARGRALTYLIVDEAAFIPEMEKHWKAMYPTLSAGGNCIVISTVHGMGNWYEIMYHEAEKGQNLFKVIDLSYKEHPDYNNDKWVREQKAQLGEKGWKQEVMGDFLGSGDTYIDQKILTELHEKTLEIKTKRRSFAQYLNQTKRSEETWDQDGALWVWKEPQEGREYIASIDAAEGVGDEGDNSCIQIIDNASLEQVAEFYSNNIPPFLFSQVVTQLGIFYNHALVVVEDMGAGGAILNNLQYVDKYENLYYNVASKNPKAGIKITPTNRPVILECLQRRLTNKSLNVNSHRLVKELNTFIYNPQTRKAEAQKGKGIHDDAIMAMAIGVYIRDALIRDIPIGSEVAQEMEILSGPINYEEIRKEIIGSSKENSLDDDFLPHFTLEDESLPGVAINLRRRLDSLLKDFGW